MKKIILAVTMLLLPIISSAQTVTVSVLCPSTPTVTTPSGTTVQVTCTPVVVVPPIPPPPPVPPPIPSKLVGTFQGTVTDRVGTTSLTPDGKSDFYIKLTGLQSNPVKVVVTGIPEGLWQIPLNANNWLVTLVNYIAGNADLYFSQWQAAKSFKVAVTYANGTTDQADITNTVVVPPPPPPPVIIPPPPPPPVVIPPPPPVAGTKQVTNVSGLQAALSGKGGVSPGDTVYLRGGTYTTGCPAASWLVLVAGTQAAPVTFQAYPGERAIIDGPFAIGSQDGKTGAWTVFRDLEFTSLCNQNRFGAVGMSGQVDILAPNVKLINNILHDKAQGVGVWSVGQNAEVYGNLIYNYGYEDVNRGHGHAIYLQNDQGGPHRVIDNIMFNGFSEQIHAYTQAGQIRRFHIEGNTIFNPGALAVRPITNYIADNVFFGSHSAVIESLVFTKNYLYNEPGKGGSGLNLGYQYQAVNKVGTFTDNWIMGMGQHGNWTNLTFNGNKFWCGYCQYPAMITTPANSPNNTFFSLRPTGTDIFVRPNQYEAKRANITIYNWDKTAMVGVSVSNVLVMGDAYEIKDAQNYFGPPVVKGIYDGAPIQIPMTGLKIAMPIGSGFRTPIHTAPEFGVFVLRRG